MAFISATLFQLSVNLVTSQEKQWLALRYEASCLRISEVAECFSSAGIAYILIKGWAAARHYPDPSQRPFSDIDICVAPDQYGAAEILLREKELGAAVDLHRGLRHLDTAEWRDLMERSSLVPLHGFNVRVLSNEDHLRVLATHWLNDGGAKLERLDDLFHTITRAGNHFAWEMVFKDVPMHRRNWLAKAISVGVRYRGHIYDHLPFTEDEMRLPAWFTHTLEREWNSEPLYPLYYLLREPRRFAAQFRRRFPPNPIQATIEMDAPIDERSRVFYQFATFFRRIPRALQLGIRNVRRTA